jgi:RHS repeat-associated protein
VYGKIQEINKSATTLAPATKIQYTYDALGNRISQVVTTADTRQYTWYVRDAQGNLLSTYTANGNVTDLADLEVNQSERFLYGSSRLGVLTASNSVDGGPDDMQYKEAANFGRGYKQYELTNHLGNVLVTISDRKFAVSSTSNSSLIDHYEPHILTAQDYYPFGMISRVALPNNGQTYRFGFQGEMVDNDTKGVGNQIEFSERIYDPRVGRFLSIDPVTEKYPGNSPYSFAHNKVNFGNEQEGLEIIDGLFKYNRWAFNKIGLGGTWVDKLNTSLYNRFSVEGRVNQVTTAAKTTYNQIITHPGQYILNKYLEADPITGGLKRTVDAAKTVKRVGSGIARGNTDAIAEGIEIAAQAYAGVTSTSNARAAKAGSDPMMEDMSKPLTKPLASLSELPQQQDRTFNHFTNIEGISGITGVDIKTLENLKAGESMTVNELKFGQGTNTFMSNAINDIFVTDLPATSTARQLNDIGVFGNKQGFVISISEEAAFGQGVRIRGANAPRGIYTIPGGTRLQGIFKITKTGN